MTIHSAIQRFWVSSGAQITTRKDAQYGWGSGDRKLRRDNFTLIVNATDREVSLRMKSRGVCLLTGGLLQFTNMSGRRKDSRLTIAAKKETACTLNTEAGLV